ncbi:energy-coupling factor transporter transmembrane component T [Lentilactobacillus senioris]|uniref:energy-coupling factor transporter transmembrane component T family protein n=1 Tax=Lentilactobacillus senioris TaxID=931534 RepID=UPI00227DF5AA|nr:energy-coupling factor transporter transmembrane component T [Lentilactobacillus senioris]MCY9806474.1 energy-coupling factor transporter transmembrane component T [Lentilactobacillus senioris]
MNAGLKLFLTILVAIEISFVTNLTVNLVVIGVSLIILLFTKIKWRSLVKLFFWPLFPAAGLLVSQLYYGNGGPLFAWILFTRIYAYVFVGAIFTETTDLTTLALTLEQNFHLPAKFAYGVLAAFNLLPKIVEQVKTIKTAGLMRGVVLHFWSPQLYFKAILASISWSENLAEAMTSHGFVEGQRRSFRYPIRLNYLDWGAFFIIIGALQLLIWWATNSQSLF